MYWKLVSLTDTRARLLADRHYSRRAPGSRHFCPPGNNIVLLGLNDDALWVSNFQGYRKDGFACWTNPYFRNESGMVASELITQALQITMDIWKNMTVPADGFHTFIDTSKVKPTIRRSREIWGYSYLKAGFSLHPLPTKDRGFLRYIFNPSQLSQLVPVAPIREQLVLVA